MSEVGSEQLEHYIDTRALARRQVCEKVLKEARKIKDEPTKALIDILDVSDLTHEEKLIFVRRILHILQKLNTRKRRFTNAKNVANVVVQIGSVITPALVSIQASYDVYWSLFGVSLATGVLTTLLNLFSAERLSLMFSRSYEHMLSESFKFFATGDDEEFSDFVCKIEKLHLDDVKAELRSDKNTSSNDTLSRHDAMINRLMTDMKDDDSS